MNARLEEKLLDRMAEKLLEKFFGNIPVKNKVGRPKGKRGRKPGRPPKEDTENLKTEKKARVGRPTKKMEKKAKVLPTV